MHTHNVSMTEGRLFGPMIRYTIPLILTGILQLLFNAADLIIVGQFGASKSNAVAAVGCTTAITALITNFFIGCSAGSGITVAHAIGEKKDIAIHRAVHTIIPFAFIGGAVLSVLGICLADPLLTLMSTPENIKDLSTVYMTIIFAGMLPNMVFNFGAAVLRAAGESKKPLYYLVLAGIVNVLLNLVFVLVFNMDVAGVALATVIAHIISATLVIISLVKRDDACKLIFKKIRFYSEPLKKIFRLGIPAGIQSSLFSISNVIVQSSINSLETTYIGVVAGNAAAQNIQNFAFATNNAYYQTAMNFAGQNVGAQRYDRVRKITRISLLMTAVSGIIIGVLMTVFAEPLVSIYVTDSPEALRWGVIRMFYVCLPFFLGGVMDISTGVLRGMGLSLFPMFASVLGVCVFRIVWIFTIFQLPAYHTPQSLWISYAISWILTYAIQQTILSVTLSKKIKGQLTTERTKMTVNLHTHTYRCGHASGKPEQYVKRAIKNGIKVMGFSEHAPCASLDGISNFRLPFAQVKEYFAEINKLKEKYKNKIEIYIGFEMEYYPDRFEEMYGLAKENGADYLILGQHFTGNEYPDGVYTGRTEKTNEVLTAYVDAVINGMKTGVFTYVCHPDVIVHTLDEEFYSNEMTRLCEAAKEYDIPLEINFYGIRDNRFYPYEKFWEIAGKVGCTVAYGFDAHDTASAYDGASISAADELVRKYGLKLCENPKIVKLH